jgi:hypothetical protein
MTSEVLAVRLLDARARLEALRPAVEAGEPWPPSEHFGTEPEASWNPPELLAHVAEMLPFWLGQIERILDGYPEPVSFGRVQDDPDRIAAIERDRALPVGELYARIAMTVRAVVERMVINHLNDHTTQLATILEPADGAS